MQVIICGGRLYHFFCNDIVWLNELRRVHDITHVLHGAARGVETQAARWATQNGVIPVSFPADWPTLGRAAGPIRNSAMLQALLAIRDVGTSVAVLAFPGGHGTKDMVTKALKAGVIVWQQEAVR